LHRALSDEMASIVGMAVEILGMLGDDSSVSLIISLLRSHNNKKVRESAVDALCVLARSTTNAPYVKYPATSAIIAATRDRELSVAQKAVEACMKLGQFQAVVQAYQTRSEKQIRLEAVEYFGEMMSRHPPAWVEGPVGQVLVQAVGDIDADVEAEAWKALSPTVDHLLSNMRNPNSAVRLANAKRLLALCQAPNLASRDRELILDQLLFLLRDPVADVQNEAGNLMKAGGLKLRREDRVRLWASAVLSRSDPARSKAIGELGKMNEEIDLDIAFIEGALKGFLQDPRWWVRHEAERVLSTLPARIEKRNPIVSRFAPLSTLMPGLSDPQYALTTIMRIEGVIGDIENQRAAILDALWRGLMDSSENVRVEALKVLNQLPAERLLDIVLKLRKDGRAAVRLAVFDLLKNLARRPTLSNQQKSRVLKAIRSFLSDKDPALRILAVSFLPSLRSVGDVGRILALHRDKSLKVRVEMLKALREYGAIETGKFKRARGRITQILFSLLKDKDVLVRQEARNALIWIGLSEARQVEMWTEILKDSWRDNRIKAIDALKTLWTSTGNRRIKDRIRAVLRSSLVDKEPDVRVSVISALASFQVVRDVGPIMALRRDPELKVRIAIVQALSQYGRRDVLGVVVSLLNDKEMRVRQEAGVALARFGLNETQQVGVWSRVLKGPGTAARIEAIDALKRLHRETLSRDVREQIGSLLGRAQHENTHRRILDAIHRPATTEAELEEKRGRDALLFIGVAGSWGAAALAALAVVAAALITGSLSAAWLGSLGWVGPAVSVPLLAGLPTVVAVLFLSQAVRIWWSRYQAKSGMVRGPDGRPRLLGAFQKPFVIDISNQTSIPYSDPDFYDLPARDVEAANEALQNQEIAFVVGGHLYADQVRLSHLPLSLQRSIYLHEAEHLRGVRNEGTAYLKQAVDFPRVWWGAAKKVMSAIAKRTPTVGAQGGTPSGVHVRGSPLRADIGSVPSLTGLPLQEILNAKPGRQRAMLIQLLSAPDRIRVSEILGPEDQTGHDLGDLSEVVSRDLVSIRSNTDVASEIQLRRTLGQLIRQAIVGGEPETLEAKSFGSLLDEPAPAARAQIVVRFTTETDVDKVAGEIFFALNRRAVRKEQGAIRHVQVVHSEAVKQALEERFSFSIEAGRLLIMTRSEADRLSQVLNVLEEQHFLSPQEEADISVLFTRDVNLEEFNDVSFGGIRLRFYLIITEALNPVLLEVEGNRLDGLEPLLRRVQSQA
ncbi:MAG: HEAT repeat domain-containing protein, partial [Elusimicrobia bacterium]|nr:HEAT repeat domain-containing protein [Candidatus Obscuribacterium magneticum]